MGVEGRIVFVDTVGTFRPERVKEIASCRGVDPDSVFSRLDIFPCRSASQQLSLLTNVRSMRKGRVRLLLLDTISDNFLFEYRWDKRIVQRQVSLASHLLDLAHFALKNNATVVFTNGLRDNMLGGVKEVASSALDHGLHVKVMLRRAREGWIAELVRPRRDVQRCVEFRIRPEGVTDL